MVKVFIDSRCVEVKEGTTLLAAAKSVGISIPHFCYHSAFEPEGSCRMCLVEIESVPKLELACSTRVREGMKVWTQSEKVVEARKGVLEFLLAEHPLDCPICDKAGECKLQDYYEAYGLFDGQFKETKIKKTKKVPIGKGLILDRERCILCTRCVRFLREVTKTEELGVFNRGLSSEISCYDTELVGNNYSGNLTELCPVGAITHEDFRFKIRTWFLEKKDSLCPLCNRGCNISIESHSGFARIPRKKKVYRIVSRENPDINGHWICDFGRYGYSYLNEKKPEAIFLRNNGKAQKLSREEAVQYVVERVKKLYFMKKTRRVTLIANSWLSNEELFLIRKIFCDDLGVTKIYMVDPPDGGGDGFLLTPERTPNKKGAQELGFDFKKVTMGELASETDILFIFGHYLTAHFNLGVIKGALDSVKTKVLFTPSVNELESEVDLVIPTCLIAEKGGTLTNVEGKVQSFTPALQPEGESLPEWFILLDLAKKLDIHFSYYHKLTSPPSVFEELGREFPFFSREK